jgi:PadR family transcriptional regulator PadR
LLLGIHVLKFLDNRIRRVIDMNIGKDLVAASATPLVLAILKEGKSYGYAIVKRVEELSGGEISWADGMLYPLLHRLERNGYIRATWGMSESGRKRKYYQLTIEGREELARQLQQWELVHTTIRNISPLVLNTAIQLG